MITTISTLLPNIFWILLSGIFLTLGDIALRMWFASDLHNGFLTAFLLYMTGIFCMMMSFFEKNIAVATIATVLVNIIIYLLVSNYLYGDTINGWHLFGIILGCIAIIIFELH